MGRLRLLGRIVQRLREITVSNVRFKEHFLKSSIHPSDQSLCTVITRDSNGGSVSCSIGTLSDALGAGKSTLSRHAGPLGPFLSHRGAVDVENPCYLEDKVVRQWSCIGSYLVSPMPGLLVVLSTSGRDNAGFFRYKYWILVD